MTIGEYIEQYIFDHGLSINGLINALLRADMGLSDDEWRRKAPGDE